MIYTQTTSHENMELKYSKDDLKMLAGKKVEITYQDFMACSSTMSGMLEVVDGWIYTYNNGHTGKEYGGKLCISDEIFLSKIIKVREI